MIPGDFPLQQFDSGRNFSRQARHDTVQEAATVVNLLSISRNGFLESRSEIIVSPYGFYQKLYCACSV